MSLPILMQADENYGLFNIVNKSVTNDEYGGYIESYTIGAAFNAVLVLDDSIQAQRAEQDGVKGVYTLVTDKNTPLAWHTVIIRDRDKAVYRVTSKDEHSTPSTSSMNLREMQVEEYILTKDVKPSE